MAKFSRAEIRKIVGDNCTDEIENALITLHLSVVDPLKDDLDRYKSEADKVKDLQTQLDEAKKGSEFKDKYEKEHKDFEDYKKSVEQKEARGAKEKAVRAYFESKGITGANLDIAMRGSTSEIDAVEMDGEKIKDTKALDELIGGTYKGLVGKTRTVGATTANPPSNTGGGKMSKEEIYKKDDKGRFVLDATARQKALAELMEE